MFTMNPELDQNNPLESLFMYQYAAFYLTSGTCRSPTRRHQASGRPYSRARAVATRRSRIRPAPCRPSRSTTPSAAAPYVWVYKHKPGAAMDDPTCESDETIC